MHDLAAAANDSARDIEAHSQDVDLVRTRCSFATLVQELYSLSKIVTGCITILGLGAIRILCLCIVRIYNVERNMSSDVLVPCPDVALMQGSHSALCLTHCARNTQQQYTSHVIHVSS